MKTLYLIRHAKSSWEETALADYDRPLNDRGLRDAPYMGKRLKEKQVTPDLMLSSSAVRALATCTAMARLLGYAPSRIHATRQLYLAEEEDLLEIVHELQNNLNTVLLFGHNPGLTYFANTLLKEHIMNIPTCGVVCATFDVQAWKEITPGSGKLHFFDFPKKNNSK